MTTLTFGMNVVVAVAVTLLRPSGRPGTQRLICDLSANGVMPRHQFLNREELVMCTNNAWGLGHFKNKGLSSQEHLFQECPTPWPLAWHKAPQQKIFTLHFFFPKIIRFGVCKTTKKGNWMFQNAKRQLVQAFNCLAPSMEEESNWIRRTPYKYTRKFWPMHYVVGFTKIKAHVS